MAKAKEISLDELVGSKDTKLKKPKQQKEKEVKNSNKKTIVVSVVSTLAVLATIVAIFYAGMQYEKGRQDVIVQEATKLSKQLKEKSDQ